MATKARDGNSSLEDSRQKFGIHSLASAFIVDLRYSIPAIVIQNKIK